MDKHIENLTTFCQTIPFADAYRQSGCIGHIRNTGFNHSFNGGMQAKEESIPSTVSMGEQYTISKNGFQEG